MTTRGASSVDHIVPKVCFAQVPDDILTIRCCKACNNVSKAADDQAFSAYLGLMLGSQATTFDLSNSKQPVVRASLGVIFGVVLTLPLAVPSRDPPPLLFGQQGE
jgi:hypothetical protein